MTPFEIMLIILVLCLGVGIWYSLKIWLNKPQNDTVLIEWLKSTSVTLQQSDKNVTDTLQQSYLSLNERLDTATRVISELKTETGKFSEIGRSMQSLQDFLNSPKLRGNIGEQILRDLMAQVLPDDSFETQYHFHSGDIVDAVIKTKAGLISVDSKFPMENFSKLSKSENKKEEDELSKIFATDVKKHIKAIAQKYIRTNENTVDFALMYIPAESIYYEITANQPELSQYAQDLRVLPVSPSTFYAFLRTILVSFEGQRIAKEASAILRELRTISKESSQFSSKLETLSRHITNAYNNMSSVTADFNSLQTKITQTNSLSTGLDHELPKIE
jgi:DNA recombination protein RmuC